MGKTPDIITWIVSGGAFIVLLGVLFHWFLRSLSKEMEQLKLKISAMLERIHAVELRFANTHADRLFSEIEQIKTRIIKLEGSDRRQWEIIDAPRSRRDDDDE